MDGNNIKKDDENGLLPCEIYSSPAAAHRLSLQRLGRQSFDISKKFQSNMALLHLGRTDRQTENTIP